MARKKDGQGRPKIDISGTWHVVELPDLDDDYLDLTPAPRITLEAGGRGELDGDYEFGAQSGAIDGRLERLPDGGTRLTFTFEGQDELDPVHGYGEAILVDEDTLKGYMRYHLGDTYRFVWKRASE